MVQPVVGAGPELDLLGLKDTERPVNRQVVIEIGSGAHIWIILTALGPDRGRVKAVPIHALVVDEARGWIAGQHGQNRDSSIGAKVCSTPNAAADPLGFG